MMETIVTFPSTYARVGRSVASVRFPHALDDPEGNADFFVRLHDGRSFSFLAITPENLRHQMGRGGIRSFLSPGMVVVSAVTAENILDAVESWLRLGESEAALLAHFGVLQIDADDDGIS